MIIIISAGVAFKNGVSRQNKTKTKYLLRLLLLSAGGWVGGAERPPAHLCRWVKVNEEAIYPNPVT